VWHTIIQLFLFYVRYTVTKAYLHTPTRTTGVFVFVWYLFLRMSGKVHPSSSYATTGAAIVGFGTYKSLHHYNAGIPMKRNWMAKPRKAAKYMYNTERVITILCNKQRGYLQIDYSDSMKTHKVIESFHYELKKVLSLFLNRTLLMRPLTFTDNSFLFLVFYSSLLFNVRDFATITLHNFEVVFFLPPSIFGF
jgi:hypothetical protein